MVGCALLTPAAAVVLLRPLRITECNSTLGQLEHSLISG
jgi:hypothetical protein